MPWLTEGEMTGDNVYGFGVTGVYDVGDVGLANGDTNGLAFGPCKIVIRNSDGKKKINECIEASYAGPTLWNINWNNRQSELDKYREGAFKTSKLSKKEYLFATLKHGDTVEISWGLYFEDWSGYGSYKLTNPEVLK